MKKTQQIYSKTQKTPYTKAQETNKTAQSTNYPSAQGTTEYLVIVGIVVVISLVVVGLMTGFLSQGSGVSDKSSKLYWQTQPLAIIDSQVDSNGYLIISIKNNTGEQNTITSLTVNGTTTYPDSLTIGIGETKTIFLNKPATGATTSNTINISYTTPSGITKTLAGTTNLTSQSTTTITPTSSVIKLNQTNCFDWNGSATQHTICTCDDLNTIDYNTTTLGWTYILQNNLDFRNCNTTYTTGLGWRPIGTSTAKFTGNFKGNNKTIKNTYINRPDQNYIGLFGYINAVTNDINDLGMIDSNITGYRDVGGISGYSGRINNSYNTGKINGLEFFTGGINGASATVNNSYNTGTVNGYSNVGGINGYLGTINNSYNTGTITSSVSYTGGISGDSGTVTSSYNTGTISGSTYTGGINGNGGTINNSNNSGTINGASWWSGGITGSGGTINNSYNTGTVNGTQYTGGINGNGGIVNNSYNTGTIIGTGLYTGGIIGNGGTITNSYNSGTINGTWEVGGINGQYGIVTNSYNMGAITGTGNYIGGIIGLAGTITNSYNTGKISGSASVGGIGGYFDYGSITKNSLSTGSIFGSTFIYGAGKVVGNAQIYNLYWYDTNTSDNATSCSDIGDANCTIYHYSDTNYTQLYSQSTPLYTTSPVWDANWVWHANSYPTLSWQ
jgi:hypothetical protein